MLRSPADDCWDVSGISYRFTFHVLKHGLVEVLIGLRSPSDYNHLMIFYGVRVHTNVFRCLCPLHI